MQNEDCSQMLALSDFTDDFPCGCFIFFGIYQGRVRRSVAQQGRRHVNSGGLARFAGKTVAQPIRVPAVLPIPLVAFGGV